MLRRAFPLAALLAATLVPSWARPARGDEDSRTALEFVQALRERGYFDLAGDYLEKLRAEKGTPDSVRAVIDYEFGRLLIDEASKSGDLVRRKELLEQARTRLETFTKTQPNHELASEALVQLARLLVERGHLAVLLGEETEDKAEKNAKLVEARTSFDQARAAYIKADERLRAEFKQFPNFLPEDDPRKEKRDRTHAAMMDAELQKAIVDYEQGQTFPLGSKERTDYLASGLKQFEEIYKNYRTQWAGLTARMWQAKCFEERGDIGPALGIYNELIDHPDPRLRPLQRHVGYFKIIAHSKRKEYALAADESVRWLQKFSSPDERHSREGLGVQFELAKNIVAQLPDVSKASERDAAIKRVTDVLSEIVRFSSPFKSEAIAMLQQYKPKVALNALNIANLNYEDAISQSDQAIASHEWDRAIALLKQAVRRADPAKDHDKANYARYNMAFCYYMNKQYYEADVLCEHLARRYPQGSLSAKATEIGMASLADAYNTYREIDRGSDLNRLIDLANYAAETWPDNEQGDGARMVLGQVYHGFGQYPKAIAAYESVRSSSAKWIDAQTRVGASHWEQSKVLRAGGTPEAEKDADAEVQKAIGSLKAALKARQDAGIAAADPGLIGNAADMADIYLETGKADDALKLLDPIAKANQPNPSPSYARLMSDLLRSHVATNQVDLALADMNALENSGGGGESLTQLYFSLGKLLEKEIDRLKAKGDSAGLNRTQQAYQKFLEALANSKSGQTYESLQWAGEQMLLLSRSKEAGAVFDRVLEKYGKDPAFLEAQGGRERIMRTELRRASALRFEGDFAAADAAVEQLIKDSPRSIEPRIEKGLLIEAKASAARGKQATTLWTAAYNHWRTLALQLAGARPKPPEYYDAWYHTALALYKDGKPADAKKTLASVMRLSATVGGPEIKAKYVDLLQQIK
jgi:tetratricopeptide (TPR) repeat protein